MITISAVQNSIRIEMETNENKLFFNEFPIYFTLKVFKIFIINIRILNCFEKSVKAMISKINNEDSFFANLIKNKLFIKYIFADF